MILKHALKTAIATGILAALFQNSDLSHIQYPVMGLVATMLTSVGDTVKAGWGRLGGSAVAGVFATLIIGSFGSSPITGAVAFFLSSLCCELFGWKALVGQAGAIAALIAAAPSLGADPAVYALQRVGDNGIGVLIGTLVTYFFWPERPRQILQNHLIRILEHTAAGLPLVLRQDETAQADLERYSAEIYRLTQASETLLGKSLYGFLGRQLVQDNWSDRIATERRLRRHLLAMSRMLKAEHPNPLVAVFLAELQNVSLQIATVCSSLGELLQPNQRTKATKVEIPNLESGLSPITDRLAAMRAAGEIRTYPLAQVLPFYDLLSTLTRLTQDLDQLAVQLQSQTQEVTPRRAWKLPVLPIPVKQVKHYFKVAIALGVTLAIVDFTHLDYGYYAAIALIVAMQPTLGKGIEAGGQRVLGTGLGALVAVVVVNTLGSNPLTVGLGILLTMLACNYLGMALAGYKGGCFLVAITIMVHGSDPSGFIWGRFSETLLGFAIAMAISLPFPPETASAKLDPSLSQTYSNLGKLLEQVIDNYLQGLISTPGTAPLTAQIRQAIKTQSALQTETKLEYIEGFRSALVQQRWNFFLSYERTVLTSLLSLQQAMALGNSLAVAQLVLAELEAAKDTTVLAFQELARSIHGQANPQRLAALNASLDAIELKLERLRPTGITSKFDVNQITAFFGVLAALRELAENLEQMGKDWPKANS